MCTKVTQCVYFVHVAKDLVGYREVLVGVFLPSPWMGMHTRAAHSYNTKLYSIESIRKETDEQNIHPRELGMIR